MRRPEFTLSPRQFQQDAIAWLIQVFQVSDYGRKLPASLLAKLWVMASALGCSLSAAAQCTRRSPSDETVRKGVHAALPLAPDELERRIVAGLQSMLPRRFFRRGCYVALDLHQRPYYGKTEHVPVCGGKHQAGTHWFWTWGTVAVVDRGQRWTLAMVQVAPGDPWEKTVARLLDYLREAKIPVKLLLLDRGFYSAEVIRLLQRRRFPFLMPVIRRGRCDGPQGPSGTQRFFQHGMRGFFEHQWQARGGKRPAGQPPPPTVRVRVACVPPPPEKKRHRRPWVYVFHGVRPPNLTWIRETYRKRFGIETSYRQLGQGLALTTSHEVRQRMLLVGVALLLRNLWVWRNQQVHPSTVTLSLLLHQLLHAISHDLELLLDFQPCKTTSGSSP